MELSRVPFRFAEGRWSGDGGRSCGCSVCCGRVCVRCPVELATLGDRLVLVGVVAVVFLLEWWLDSVVLRRAGERPGDGL
jgi:hypothetical protein